MPANTESASILALAETVLEQTRGVTKYLQANNLAAPTFSPKSSSPPDTPEYVALQNSLRTSLEDLQRLIDGPKRFYRSLFPVGYDLAAFQIALDFDFFTLVPADGEISLNELASKSNLDLDRASRVVRLLVTHRFFQEHKPGFISHNSFSIALQDDDLRAVVHFSWVQRLPSLSNSRL